MSSEKIIQENENLSTFTTPKVVQKELPIRVDINNLLARVREEKKKENKVNFIFLFIFAALILTVGIILSL